MKNQLKPEHNSSGKAPDSQVRNSTDLDRVGKQVLTATDSELEQLVETLCARLPQLLHDHLKRNKVLDALETVAREQRLRADAARVLTRNKLKKTSAKSVLLKYPIPAGRKIRPRVKPLRKGEFPGLKIRLAGWQILELRAAAKCMGWGFTQFVRSALWQAIWDAEEKLGIEAAQLVVLNKKAKAELAAHFHLVHAAMRRVNGLWNLDRN